MSEEPTGKQSPESLARQYVRKLAEAEGTVVVDPSMKPIRYINASKEMYRMAITYHSEADNVRAFKLCMRFMTLFVEKFPRHPAYVTVTDSEKRNINQLVREVMKIAEELKPKLIKEFTDAEILKEAEEKRRSEAEAEERRKTAASASQRQTTVAGQRDLLASDKVAAKPKAPEPPPPSFNDLNFSSGVQLPKVDDKTALRTMTISSKLSLEFLNLAASNTRQNRETCGVLCGRLVHNEFHCTHVIVPKQSGTSDTCDTLEEHEIFAVLEQHDLITLGWIHTHPSQTAFLSSVDLHTHYGYQCLLPEAIAIVCSPRYNEIGYFSLTASCGIPTLSSCRQTGFHEHKTAQSQPLFESAPFVRVTSDSNFHLIDLR